jgi:hypothetical protein
MVDFYIKRITATGKGKRNATVEFTKGLNIMCGISDTGKSCVLLCIDYIFGSNVLPFDKGSTGYSKVQWSHKFLERIAKARKRGDKHAVSRMCGYCRVPVKTAYDWQNKWDGTWKSLVAKSHRPQPPQFAH